MFSVGGIVLLCLKYRPYHSINTQNTNVKWSITLYCLLFVHIIGKSWDNVVHRGSVPKTATYLGSGSSDAIPFIHHSCSKPYQKKQSLDWGTWWNVWLKVKICYLFLHKNAEDIAPYNFVLQIITYKHFPFPAPPLHAPLLKASLFWVKEANTGWKLLTMLVMMMEGNSSDFSLERGVHLKIYWEKSTFYKHN